ncbi:hypothetical protein EMIT0P201_10067 [Pseudomonas chlororaphis]
MPRKSPPRCTSTTKAATAVRCATCCWPPPADRDRRARGFCVERSSLIAGKSAIRLARDGRRSRPHFDPLDIPESSLIQPSQPTLPEPSLKNFSIPPPGPLPSIYSAKTAA